MAHMTNPLATPEQLHQRARFSSLPTDLQDTIFYTTQCLTQAAGLLLQLPQSTTAQANVLLARYWLVDSEMQHEFSDVSAACIYIVAKCGPFPRSPRDVTNVYAYLLSPASPLARPPNTTNADDTNDPTKYYQSQADYFAAHNRILALEGRILYALSFDTRVALPHPLAVTYLQALDFLAQPREVVSERAVAYLNAALLSPQLLYLTHQPNALAVAAIYNAARDLGAKMPECEWWEVFDVEREELGFLVVGLRSLEGWVRQQKKEGLASGDEALVPALLGGEGGLLTRRLVEAEMQRRGLQLRQNGGGSQGTDAAGDDEAEMMRKLDERVASMEES
ncbi:hypothetical protein PpBr36_00950 [Pyricularia pennisetigena]|uniref:hypothetical protein n=1 Tax=Pyricularia pennisetigena TaxID=1578925 RepID=UPI0011516C33|nr:hypothetical protein PpBr36_00950 [Pyricularia pennisetigena]TLS28242.1 hypothetical protein PpBr36_00950 [Pyricularia pennisetigena]